MTLVEDADNTDAGADPIATPRIPGEHGIWVFVFADLLVFALFFATFLYSRAKQPESFATAHAAMNLPLGLLNTVVLLSSSLYVAIGVARVNAGVPRRRRPMFSAAMVCGVGFALVKIVEWILLFAQGKGVGSGEYFSYYFMFTAIHLGHVVVGLAVLRRLNTDAGRATCTPADRRRCETGGIYWHMVDLLWVVLFALFYVVR